MEKFTVLLEKLTALKIVQKHGDWSEELPEDIYIQHFEENYKEVAQNLDIDTHRWYEVSTTVINIYDKFLGIRYITNLFSESSSHEDCYYTIQFFEMKEVMVKSYEKIG